MLLSPLFFANIGLKVVLPQMNFMIVSFTIIICIVAILSKVIGCGLGAKLWGVQIQEALMCWCRYDFSWWLPLLLQ